ncbi:MAG: YfcC family protein [Synergistaceae bacterium]
MKFKIPHAFTLLFYIVAIACVLTWVIPGGQYTYEEVNVGGTVRKMVIPDSFHYIEASKPANIIDFFGSFHKGMIEVANIIALIFIVNGAFSIVIKTGSFEKMLGTLLRRLEGKENLIVIIFYSIFAMGATLFGMWNDFNGMIPIMVGVGVAMGYDAMFGFAIAMLGIGVGFAAAITNPYTIVVAQTIAGIPLYSGMGMRVAILIVFSALSLWWIFRYGKRIKADPSLSLVTKEESLFSYDRNELKNLYMGKKENATFVVILICLAIIFYGCLYKGWGNTELTGVFLMMGIIVALIFKWDANKIAVELIDGAKGVVYGALIVGVARAILVVMRDAMIIDTIIHFLAELIDGAPLILAAEGMLFIQTIINFFISSGSGQASTVIPIMAPLGDVAGLTREVTVLAFQFGDGFSNLLWPTANIAIGCGIAGISIATWWKFFLKLYGIMTLAMMAFIAVAVVIGF